MSRGNIAIVAALVGLVVCAGLFAIAPGKRTGRIVVTGSSTIAPVMLEIGRAFERHNPGFRVDVQTGGSSRGIRDVRRGLADVGMVSRKLTNDDADLVSHLIARDGICLIVHASNSVSELSREQIIAMYTGQITNWKAVGGADLPITIVHKAAGRATNQVFLEFFDLTEQQIHADVVIGDNEQGVKTVASNPTAIGYVSFGTAFYDQTQGVPIKMLPLQGVMASTEEIATGNYPMTRDLVLVTQGPARGEVRELIEFAQSVEAGELIRGLYLVPISR